MKGASKSVLLPDAHWTAGAITDAVLLSAIIAPLLWYLVVTPRRMTAVGEKMLAATAIESAADGIGIYDRDGTFLWVNPAFTKITGYSPEEAIGRNPRLLKLGI